MGHQSHDRMVAEAGGSDGVAVCTRAPMPSTLSKAHRLRTYQWCNPHASMHPHNACLSPYSYVVRDVMQDLQRRGQAGAATVRRLRSPGADVLKQLVALEKKSFKKSDNWRGDDACVDGHAIWMSFGKLAPFLRMWPGCQGDGAAARAWALPTHSVPMHAEDGIQEAAQRRNSFIIVAELGCGEVSLLPLRPRGGVCQVRCVPSLTSHDHSTSAPSISADCGLPVLYGDDAGDACEQGRGAAVASALRHRSSNAERRAGAERWRPRPLLHAPRRRRQPGCHRPLQLRWLCH